METLTEFLIQKNLNEIFDNPEHVNRNRELEKDLSLPSIEVWDSKSAKFVLFKYNNAWEIHILNPDTNDGQMTNIFKGAGASKVIATAIYLIKNKLDDKNTPFRIYGDTEKKTNIWLNVIKKQFPSGLIFKEIKPIIGVDGAIYPIGYLINKDRRTLKLENLTFYL